MIDGQNIIIRLGSDYSVTDKGFQVTWEAYGIPSERQYFYLKGTKQETHKDGVEQKTIKSD